MALETILQLVTVVVAAMAIVWHQQRGNDALRGELNTSNQQLREELNTSNQQLRSEFNTSNQQLREELNTSNQQLREELNTSNQQLRSEFNTSLSRLNEAVAENGQRLARIEGCLGIGMQTVSDASVEAGPK
ncbi:MAG: hypothetical protein OXB92_08625 [Acidimicrobiaceae bacterium]|nr:hypothetical protein [Acidimicrobiia bacterium]MCY4493903.1 hypothetical protein [Acidimicrobiaceae bacterium]